MKINALITVLLTFLAAVASQGAEDFSRADVNHFERTIRPILIKHCIQCHGPQRQEGGLRLDSRDLLLTGGTRGAAVNLKKAKDSLILKAINHDNDLAMPPDQKLSASVIANFSRWLARGAAWPDTFELPVDLDPTRHWAFQPISNPPVPQITHPNGVGSSIDPFVLARLAKQDLKPAPRATKHTLARRVYQDLTGLPPSVDELNAYLNNQETKY